MVLDFKYIEEAKKAIKNADCYNETYYVKIPDTEF